MYSPADKVPDDQKSEAHEVFQSIAFAYAVLSDPARRRRYDATGSTDDSIVDSEGFDWSDYYRQQFKDAISADAIKQFAAKYKGSAEERDDLLAAYEECEGEMDQVYERVILSDVTEDDERFRRLINEAIKKKHVPAFSAYTMETKKKRTARVEAARAEAEEAEEYAKELGLHDKLFKNGKGKAMKAKADDGDLAALIQRRRQDWSANLVDHLAEKYGTAEMTGAKKGKRRRAEVEPSEEAFQAAAARLKSSKSSKQGG